MVERKEMRPYLFCCESRYTWNGKRLILLVFYGSFRYNYEARMFTSAGKALLTQSTSLLSIGQERPSSKYFWERYQRRTHHPNKGEPVLIILHSISSVRHQRFNKIVPFHTHPMSTKRYSSPCPSSNTTGTSDSNGTRPYCWNDHLALHRESIIVQWGCAVVPQASKQRLSGGRSSWWNTLLQSKPKKDRIYTARSAREYWELSIELQSCSCDLQDISLRTTSIRIIEQHDHLYFPSVPRTWLECRS